MFSWVRQNPQPVPHRNAREVGEETRHRAPKWEPVYNQIEMFLFRCCYGVLSCETAFRNKVLEPASPFSYLFLSRFPFPVSLLRSFTMSCLHFTVDMLNSVCHMYEDICQNPPKQHGVQSSFLLLSPICAYTNPTGIQL